MKGVSFITRLASQKQFSSIRTACAAKLLALLLLLALPVVARAQFRFTTNNGAITITAWTGPANGPTAVAIPATTNGFPVTSIGYSAFGCTFLTSVTMPNSITNIGDSAFRLGQLQSVTIPDSVLSIGSSAFQSCPKLTNATLGTNVISIGISAFANCYVLPSITIPSSVSSIGTNAFYYSTRLTEITVDPQNTNYSSVDGVLFNKSQTALLQFPAGKAGTYTVPNSVTNIGDHAFHYCTNLTSVTIPGSVTNIGSYAFSDCTPLRSAYFRGNAPNGDSSVFRYDNMATVYYLPGTTNWGATFCGRPTALWQPQLQAGGPSFGVRTNQFGFNINWASGQTVVVEACTDLANPAWTPVGTNTLTDGSSYFSDPEWPNYPARLYRLRSP